MMFFTRKNTNFKSYYESKIIYPPIFFGIFLVLLLFSCTNDELENSSTNPVINQLKNDLKLEQFTNKNISENLVVNWETFSKIEKDGFEIYQIGITETNEVKISSKIFQESLKYELIAIKKDSTVFSYFIEAFSSVHNDLAWGTLQEASIFREKYKDGDPVKARILNRYRTESSGRSVEVNTTLQQNPIGKPCN